MSAQAVPAGAADEVFARGTDGALWWRQLATTGWSLWQSFGGGVVGTPAAVAESGGAVSAFVRGTDGALYRRRYDGTTWSGWNGFGGLLTSDPVAWSNATGVYVFARGGDGALYWGKFTTGGSWSGYHRLGGAVSGRPAVAEDSSGLYVFVVGADSAVWVQRFVNDVPGGFVGLGGGVSFGLTAGVDSTGVTVYVRGNDGGPYRRRSMGGGAFAPWQPLGGYLTSVPAVTGNGPTSRLFARGGDNAPYVLTISNGAPQGWQSLGGGITSNPAATSDTNGTSVLARGLDGLLYAGRFESSWSGWQQLPSVVLGSDPNAVAAPVINAAPAAPAAGLGFDACEAPSTSEMATWRLYSPYTTVGIYIGGVNRACPNRALDSSAWLNTVRAQGWRSIPIYVGLQVPCVTFTSATMSGDPFTAFLQGSVAATDASTRAATVGLFPGSPIYFDMEGYNNADAGCVAAVQGFIDGWVLQLHQSGYAAGMYSSLCSGIVDQAAVFGTPGNYPLDAIWIAAWAFNDQNDPRYATYVPGLSGFTGCGAALPDALWSYHQRIRQFRGGHNETYAGITINIDTNAIDGPTAG